MFSSHRPCSMLPSQCSKDVFPLLTLPTRRAIANFRITISHSVHSSALWASACESSAVDWDPGNGFEVLGWDVFGGYFNHRSKALVWSWRSPREWPLGMCRGGWPEPRILLVCVSGSIPKLLLVKHRLTGIYRRFILLFAYRLVDPAKHEYKLGIGYTPQGNGSGSRMYRSILSSLNELDPYLISV